MGVGGVARVGRPHKDCWKLGNGKGLAATPIPADRPAWDTFSVLRETTQAQLRELIEGIDISDSNPERRKLADFFRSFMDEAGVEQAGLAGLRDELTRIHGLHDKAALPGLFPGLARPWVRIPLGLHILP